MKMDKLAAVLSAAALAVATLSITSFATTENVVDLSSLEINVSTSAVEIKKDAATTNAGSGASFEIKAGDSITVTLAATTTNTLSLNNQALTVANTSATATVDADGAGALSLKMDTGTVKVTAVSVTREAASTGGSTSSSASGATSSSASGSTTPAVPEGYTDLNNWNTDVKFDAKDAKAGDKLVINLANVGDDAQISINDNDPWGPLPGFAALEGFDAKWKSLDIAKDLTKYEYTFTAEDIAAINGGEITVKGKNACVKLSLESSSSGNPAEPGEPNVPNIRPVAPSGSSTEAAATTTAAPEVVTAANGESVEAPKDVIPQGAVLEVKEQPKEEAVKAVEAIKATDENKEVVETIKKAVEADKAAVLDINLVKDGAKVQPNGTIKVTINVPAALKDAANLFVYRVEDNGKLTDVKASVVGGKLVFSTGHFSTYIITSEALTGDAVVTEAAATTAAPTAPEKPDDKNQATGVVLAVIPAVIAAAGVIASKKRK